MKRLLPLLALIVFAASLSAEKCPNCPALVFKENKGQWQNNVLFKAEVKNGAVFLEKDALSFNLFDVQDMLCARGGPHKPAGCTGKNYDVSFHAFKIKLKNADSGVLASGADAISEYFNYFIGNNKSSWTSNVLGYHEISYSNLYRGIDFKITSQQNALKYLFERNNHADVAQLQLSFEGTDGLFIDKDGNLHIKTSVARHRGDRRPDAARVGRARGQCEWRSAADRPAHRRDSLARASPRPDRRAAARA